MAQADLVINHLYKDWNSFDTGYSRNAFIRGILTYNKGQLAKSPLMIDLPDLLNIDQRLVTSADVRKELKVILFLSRVFLYTPMSLMQTIKSHMLTLRQDHHAKARRRYRDVAFRAMLAYLDELGTRDWINSVPLQWAGRKIRYYDQSLDRNCKDRPNTAGGWCLGVSAAWLKCKHDRVPFWAGEGRINPKHFNSMRFIMARQSMYTAPQKLRPTGSNAQSAPVEDRFRDHFSKLGLTRRQLTERNGNPPVVSLAQQIGHLQTNAYVLISIWFEGGGGHAMAAYLTRGGAVYFMDPNLGEIRFRSRAQFAPWFPEFVRFQRYKIRSFDVFGYQ